MTVGVGGDPDRAVAQHLGDDLEVVAEVDQHRGEAVPHVVDAAMGQASVLQYPLVRTTDIALIERRPNAGRKDEAFGNGRVVMAAPQRTGLIALFTLPHSLLAQGNDNRLV